MGELKLRGYTLEERAGMGGARRHLAPPCRRWLGRYRRRLGADDIERCDAECGEAGFARGASMRRGSSPRGRGWSSCVHLEEERMRGRGLRATGTAGVESDHGWLECGIVSVCGSIWYSGSAVSPRTNNHCERSVQSRKKK